MIIDNLYEKVKEKGHVCVGLDTSPAYIPEHIIKESNSIEDAIFEFNRRIIDATHDLVPCYKVQIAYYEALGIKGMLAYKKTLDYLREKKTIIIGDIKRGDIAATAGMYAKAHFEGDFECDFITLSPYMGLDSIEPYLKYVKEKEKGLFVLIRTSNNGCKDIQCINSDNEKKIYEVVGEKINNLGKECMGNCGYSSIGGVVGCTSGEQGEEIRENLNNTFFLIPGYGAQGGAAEDSAKYLKEGNGGVINSSRGILLAYRKEDNEKHFEESSRNEVIKMRDSILKCTL